jgi:hypothetical protein
VTLPKKLSRVAVAGKPTAASGVVVPLPFVEAVLKGIVIDRETLLASRLHSCDAE